MAASTDRSGLDSLAAAAEPEPEPSEVVPPQAAAAKAKKRNPVPGVRVVGRRIYDPENGKTCHQCRQKTTDFAAACKLVKKRGPCTIKYCRKCLLNRYGEKAEEAEGNKDWTCPKCRGICNCSFCRKRNGQTPTGIMAHIAKASGCTSVHDLLEKGSDVVAAAQAIQKVNAGDKQGTKRARETVDTADGMAIEQDGNVGIDINAVPTDEGDENIGVDLNAVPSLHIKKKLKRKNNVKKNTADGSFHDGDNSEQLPRIKTPPAPEIVLPKGTLITNIAGVEIDSEVVGAAIQFCEYCRAFKEFFQIRKGQPEKILQDIVGGRELRLVSSQVAKFHMALLSVIQEGRGNKAPAYKTNGDAWVIDVGKCIRESSSMSQKLPHDFLSHGVSGYKNLSPSCKLQVLNFLCDEALHTDELRKWIDMQITGPMNAAREKARAAKEKEKELKKRLNDSSVKTTLEDQKDLISEIKEAQEVKCAALNDMATLEEQADDLWTKPLMVEKGLAYWKLEGYCDDATILLQDFGDELTGSKDKWFMFTKDEEKIIEGYIAARSRRQIRKRIRV